MKKLVILVPQGENNLSSIAGAYKIFSRANAIRKAAGGKAVFDIRLAGISDQVDFHGGLFSVRPHLRLAQIPKADLVIIPSLNHNYHHAVDLNGEMTAWIAAQYRQGAEVASICTGAFLLAAAGILEGRSCSTHWSAAADFSARFPDVRLRPDKLITDEQGICTNGGAYSFLHLVIYLVEKYFDRETALLCAKIFQISPDRQSQAEFAVFKGQKEHDDEMVKAAQEFIEGQVREKLTTAELSVRFSVGRRNFDRRFIKATGNTPVEYAQRVKMESARKAFENSGKTVNEVMYEVGYNDAKAFREVFRRITGLSPLAYRSRYNRKAAVSPATVRRQSSQ